MQQSVARGFQAAGENGGGSGMAFMGMGVNATDSVIGNFQQPVKPQYQQQAAPADPFAEIQKYKQLLDCGIITPEEFNQKKKELLGL